MIARLRLRLLGATIGHGLMVTGPIDLCLDPQSKVSIGQACRIHSGFRWNPVGGFRRMGLWVGPNGDLAIGDRVALSNSTIVSMSRVSIGDDVFIGGGCQIYDTDFHQIQPERRLRNAGAVGTAAITVGHRAFIGGHVTVLKGVKVGEAAVIGAASVVTKDVPAGQIWAGSPARFIRWVHSERRAFSRQPATGSE